MEALFGLLVCPDDGQELERGSDELVCGTCLRCYPVDRLGVVSFLPEAEADAAGWDEEAEAYATGFTDYTDAVEVVATVGRIGHPAGPVLDHGAGTGRMTAALHRSTGQPVIAVDYSREALHRLLADCGDLPVLAVHADVRHLPLRDHAVAAVCSAGVHPLVRQPDRRRLLDELARVLPPDGLLVLSTLNYSWVFRAWRLKGNLGARQGEHLHGRAIYYRRFTAPELRGELSEHFAVHKIVGIRNVPGRSLSAALQRTAGPKVGGLLSGWVERYGPHLDRGIERMPISRLTGFLLLASAVRRAGDRSPEGVT